jgi:8-oxo-dGTP diphosphatase
MLVAGGILENKGLILLAQRKRNDSYGLKWEFPGGKIDEGESGEECIVRELKEELGIDVEVLCFYDEYADDDLKILYYRLKWISGEITLNDHEQIQWVPAENLQKYDLLSVDRKVAQKLARDKKQAF